MGTPGRGFRGNLDRRDTGGRSQGRRSRRGPARGGFDDNDSSAAGQGQRALQRARSLVAAEQQARSAADGVHRLLAEDAAVWIAGDLEEQLVIAAVRLLQAVDDIVDDRNLWQTTGRPRVLGPTRQAQIRELITQNLTHVLDGIGYRPPPPTSEWAVDVNGALAAMLAADDLTRTETAREAELTLRLFAWRLRRLTQVHLQRGSHEPARARQAGISGLAQLLGTASIRLLPAGIAAGVLGLVTGGVSAVPAALQSFADEATKEMFKSAVQDGCVALLSYGRTEMSKGLSDANQEVLDHYRHLGALADLLDSSSDGIDKAAAVAAAKSTLWQVVSAVDPESPSESVGLMELAEGLSALFDENDLDIAAVDEHLDHLWHYLVGV